MVPGAIGALIGLVGTALSRATDIWEKKSEAQTQFELGKQNVEVARAELEKEKLRLQNQASVAQIEAKARADEANAKAESAIMVASYGHDKTISLEDTSKIGAFVRNVVRPILTLSYGAMFLYVIFQSLTDEIIAKEAEMIFAAFIEVAVGITLWWFGLRRGK